MLGTIEMPNFDVEEEVLNVELGPSYLDEIVSFLKNDTETIQIRQREEKLIRIIDP